MIRWRGKIAVVTGAGSGIGEAITRALLQNGVNVAALDIRKERLAKLDAEYKHKGSLILGTLHTICCDINREEEIDAAFSHVETLGGVDIMVNNAGIVDYARVIESDRKTFKRLLDTNILTVAVCMNKAVRSMRERNVEGHIFNIISTMGHSFPPESLGSMNLYPTSKHASLALTHTVQREIAEIKAPIRVTGISPGIVKTNIVEHLDTMKDIFEKVPALQPSAIADAVMYALGTSSEVQITQLTIQPTGEYP